MYSVWLDSNRLVSLICKSGYSTPTMRWWLELAGDEVKMRVLAGGVVVAGGHLKRDCPWRLPSLSLSLQPSTWSRMVAVALRCELMSSPLPRPISAHTIPPALPSHPHRLGRPRSRGSRAGPALLCSSCRQGSHVAAAGPASSSQRDSACPPLTQIEQRQRETKQSATWSSKGASYC
jgi:hypothetical protein